VAASVGMLHGAPIEFELVKDVPDGGVLFALPALLLLGLLSKSREMFSMLEGFYPLESIFLLLALIALARIPSLEALRYVAPGEWGKLMGPDRIPEVRTLRQKITQLCSEQGLAERWSNALAKSMDGAGTGVRRRLLRRWSCAGLLWKTHRSASALYCPRAASVCAARPITGLTRWTDGPFSW
jgi:hypothetical protein